MKGTIAHSVNLMYPQFYYGRHFNLFIIPDNYLIFSTSLKHFPSIPVINVILSGILITKH
jgi:hypothetical protein